MNFLLIVGVFILSVITLAIVGVLVIAHQEKQIRSQKQ